MPAFISNLSVAKRLGLAPFKTAANAVRTSTAKA